MDTAFMRKTFALIAKGLIEKEQLLQTKPTNNTQHDTTKKRSRKSGSSCYFRGMRGYISISKSSGFRRLPGTAIFL